jgi:uncharacterized protein YndB with AHSA1/START domain/uncharacterized protein YciI
MALPPIHRQTVVPAGAPAAFDVFTSRLGSWWPFDRFSVYGAGASAEFRDGALIENDPDGSSARWGTVLDWQPPRSLRMTWHPGRDESAAPVVDVTFAPVGDDATLVTVTHSGLAAAGARDEHKAGWPVVLTAFAAAFTEDFTGPQTPVVLVLSHTPAPGVGDPFRHPGFGEHATFLEGLHQQGILVGAGPFPFTGEGMTIVRVDSPSAAAGIVRAAHFDDRAVTGGVLEVRARSWVVMMHGSSLA